MQVRFFVCLFWIASGQTSVLPISSQEATKVFLREEPLQEIPPGTKNYPHNGKVTPEQKALVTSASYVIGYSRLLEWWNRSSSF